MVILYVAVTAGLLLFGILKEKNIFNPVFIFAGIWLFVGILSFMNLYDFNEVSNKAYGMIIVGVVFFCLGCYIRSRMRIKIQSLSWFTETTHDDIRYGLLIPLFLIIVIFTAMLAMRSIRLLQSGVDMETIRFNYKSIEQGIIIRNALEYDMEHYFVAIMEFVAVALFPVVLMDKGSVKKYVLLAEMAVFFVLHMMVTGARSFIFDIVLVLILYILIDYKLRSRFTEFFRKIPKLLVLIGASGATVLFVFMTLLRKGGGSLLHEIYAYFAIAPRLLDTHLQLIDAAPVYTHGMTFFHGLLRPIFVVLKAVGIPYPEAYSKAVDLINANNLYYAVGKGSANSFVTVFYYFFMDFGWISVIIGCFLYGYFSQSLYSRMMERPDKRRVAFYLLLAVGLILSFVRLHFTAHRYVYAFVILLFCFSRKKEPLAEKAPEGVISSRCRQTVSR